MKKLGLFFAMLLVCVISAPLLFACNGVGNNTVVGVRFTQDVFEADFKVPIMLSYKVYPTTAANYNVTYDFSIKDESMYTNNNGEFTIINQSCPDIVAHVYIDNTYTDSCTIKLKKYPTELSFGESSTTINKNGILNLSLSAVVGGETKAVGLKDYNIELSSTNPSVIGVESGLTIYSTGKSGSAIITARIKDSTGKYVMVGNSVLKDQIKVSVTESVSTAVVSLEGENSFITTSINSYTNTDDNTYEVSQANLSFLVMLYSSDGTLISPNDVFITAISSNQACATVEKDSSQNNKFNIEFAANGTTRIEISSGATDSNGNPMKFIFYLTKG